MKIPENFPLPPPSPWRTDRRAGERPQVAVLMSGGVDSSVAAWLLQEAGWRGVGVTMTFWAPGDSDAPEVCRQLGMSHLFLDARKAFEEHVLAPFRRAYASGETPSPCVACNTALKFGFAWEMVRRHLGISWIATGHYARVLHRPEAVRLARARDLRRDQSAFLYGIPPARLGQILFPLGELTKEEVRSMARQAELPNSERRDSMDLCFVCEGDYRQALDPALLHNPGPILDEEGHVLGAHPGIAHFTPGQRHGLGIASPVPLYVLRVDGERNALVVGPRERAHQREVEACQVRRLAPDLLVPGARLWGKVRAPGPLTPCTVERLEGDELRCRFDTPVFAPAPGQHLVLYGEEGNVVVGGGVVTAPCSSGEDAPSKEAPEGLSPPR